MVIDLKNLIKMALTLGRPDRQEFEAKVLDVLSVDEILPNIDLRQPLVVFYSRRPKSYIEPRIGYFGGYDGKYVYVCDHIAGLDKALPEMNFFDRITFGFNKVPLEKITNITLLKPEIGYRVVND